MRRRAFKMASGMEVLHGRSKKSILGRFWPPLGSLCGACLGTLAGQGWHWRASGCLFCAFLGYALWGLGFDTLPERKSDDFGTAFCAENIVNNIVFVHCTVSPQSRHFLHFGVAWGSHFACCGLLFGFRGPLGALIAALPVSLGRLQKKACPTRLHSRYIVLENGPKRTPKWSGSACPFWAPFGMLFAGVPPKTQKHMYLPCNQEKLAFFAQRVPYGT